MERKRKKNNKKEKNKQKTMTNIKILQVLHSSIFGLEFFQS